MSNVITPANDEGVLRAIIAHFLNFGARAESDSRWLTSILPADLLAFRRAEVLSAIHEKAGDPTKARKIFVSMGKTAKATFGPEYQRTKKMLDAEARAAVRKTDLLASSCVEIVGAEFNLLSSCWTCSS